MSQLSTLDIAGKIVLVTLLACFFNGVFQAYGTLKERKIGLSSARKFSENRDNLPHCRMSHALL